MRNIGPSGSLSLYLRVDFVDIMALNYRFNYIFNDILIFSTHIKHNRVNVLPILIMDRHMFKS